MFRESRKKKKIRPENAKTKNILQPYRTAGEHTVRVLKRSSSVSKKQIPENDEFSENHGMKIFFRARKIKILTNQTNRWYRTTFLTSSVGVVFQDFGS